MVEMSAGELAAERWVPVRDFEDTYEVSDFGRLRRILIPRIQLNGYVMAVLYRKRKRVIRTVHSMVAEAFIGPRPEKQDIHHKDARKANNRYTNLEYVTRGQNIQAAVAAGAFDSGKGRPRRKLNPQQVQIIISGTDSCYKLAKRFGVSAPTISDVRRGKSWRRVSGK